METYKSVFFALFVFRYDVVYVNLTHKPDWLMEKSPLNKVPCIELEEGEILYESLIIAEYLDDTYPQNKLYPNSSLAKAKDKLLIDRFNTVIATMYKVFVLYWFQKYLHIFSSITFKYIPITILLYLIFRDIRKQHWCKMYSTRC